MVALVLMLVSLVKTRLEAFNWRVQHRFSGMQHESKNGGGMQDDRNFNSGMRDENRTAGSGYAPFCRWDR